MIDWLLKCDCSQPSIRFGWSRDVWIYEINDSMASSQHCATRSYVSAYEANGVGYRLERNWLTWGWLVGDKYGAWGVSSSAKNKLPGHIW